MEKERSIDLEEIKGVVSKTSLEMKAKGIELIVAIAQGGLVLGRLFAEELGVPMLIVDYSSKQGEGTGKHSQWMPPVHYRKILIVDDIVDTGHTMKEVVAQYNRYNCNVTSFVLYYNISNVAEVDTIFHVPLSDGHKPWIVFPWEKEWETTVGKKLLQSRGVYHWLR